MSEFSIDYILNRAGDKFNGTNDSIGIMPRMKVNPFHPYGNFFNRNPSVEPDGQDSPSRSQQIFEHLPMFNWLQYSRYHPPKLQRSFRPGTAKRTPGRLPRIPFLPEQLQTLENAYKESNYLSAEDANKLAESLSLTNVRVKIWFQNRRARERRDKREKEEKDEKEENWGESTLSSNASSPEPLERQPHANLSQDDVIRN